MSPRPYRSETRQAAAAETRARVLAAARELLLSEGSFSGFSLEAVARQAGVARMTVYYQFASKRGLLEALFDDLATRGLVRGLRRAFANQQPLDVLAGLIAAFGAFWASDRLVIRRLRKMTALDPDFEQAIRARDELRRGHLKRVVELIAKDRGRPAPHEVEEVVTVLHMLSSFETFDALAGARLEPKAVIPLVQRLALAALELGKPRR
jgi:AcrR family transcriptional regulator